MKLLTTSEVRLIRFAKEIKEKIIGGHIYGVPITEENIDALIVAAWMLGHRKAEQEGTKEKDKDLTQ